MPDEGNGDMVLVKWLTGSIIICHNESQITLTCCMHVRQIGSMVAQKCKVLSIKVIELYLPKWRYPLKYLHNCI